MFIEKLNKSQNGPHVIEEEKVVAGGKWEGFLNHDNVNRKTISIYTESKLKGEKVENFFISTPSETPWKTHLKIFSSSEKVYVVYESSGDQVEAEDINKLQDTLVEEITRSTKEDNSLNTKINNEVARATAKENSIEAKLNSEITRSTNKDNTLDAKIDTEISRATSVEDGLLLNLNNYKTSNDAEVGQLKNRASLLETNKADKTYTDIELNKRYLKTQTYTKEEVLQKIQDVIGTAPEALDTLAEIANALNNDTNFASTMTNELSKKVDKIVGKQLSTEDFTTAEKAKLVGMESGANKYIHPPTHSLDIITETATKKIMTDVERSKLGGISNNAKKVENSFTNGNILIDGVETNVYTHPSVTSTHNNGVYIGVRTPKRTAGQYYEFWDSSVGWADIKAGDITSNGNMTATSFNGELNGNALTATKLQTARTINGVAFDGTANITITANPNTHSHDYVNATSVGSSADPNTTQEPYILTNHINSPGGGVYWHILTMFYQSKTGNKAQIAITYNGANQRMMIRHYYQSWTAWKEIASITDIPTKISELLNDKNYVTAAELGTAGYGDMLKSVYDKNNNGKVDIAEIADSVPWSGITGKPSTFAPSSHTHNSMSIPDTRNVNPEPKDTLAKALSSDFKLRTSVGTPPLEASASSTYAYITTISGWSSTEPSGGWPVQFSIGEKGIAIRQGLSATAWTSWRLIRTFTGGLTCNDLKGV